MILFVHVLYILVCTVFKQINKWNLIVIVYCLHKMNNKKLNTLKITNVLIILKACSEQTINILKT